MSFRDFRCRRKKPEAGAKKSGTIWSGAQYGGNSSTARKMGGFGRGCRNNPQAQKPGAGMPP
jgi:hypothetical protein